MVVQDTEQLIGVWEHAAKEGSPTHIQGHLSFSSPSERVIELTQETMRLRNYLAEACDLIRHYQHNAIDQRSSWPRD